MSSQSGLGYFLFRKNTLLGDIESLEEQIEELGKQRRILKLQRRIKMLEMEVVEVDIKRELELEGREKAKLDQVERGEKVKCRQLADKMYTRLPREVRGHVYDYLTTHFYCIDDSLCDGKILVSDCHFTSCDGFVLPEGGDKDEECWQERQFDWATKDIDQKESNWLSQCKEETWSDELLCCYHRLRARIFDSEYVSEVVAREAAEAYYTENVFYVNRRNPGRSLYRLLTWRDPRFDFPPHVFIRKICICVRLADFAPTWRWKNSDSSCEKRKLNYLHKMLTESFDLVTQKERLHVRFVVKCGLLFTSFASESKREQVESEWSLINLLEALREPIYNLVHAGSQVSLRYFDEEDSMRVMKDITAVFHLRNEEWQKEREDHIRQWNAYRPEMHYISPTDVLVDSDIITDVDHNIIGDERINKMSAYIELHRRRWGYPSFLSLLHDDNLSSSTEEGKE